MAVAKADPLLAVKQRKTGTGFRKNHAPRALFSPSCSSGCRGKHACGAKNHARMNQERDHCKFHFARRLRADSSPKYSGVLPTIWPATNTPSTRNRSRLIIPTPLPPYMQLTHIPA